MPRKVTKTGKPPLLILERPLGGSKLQNVPVRAALNPKDFFTETQAQSGSAIHAWVSPQFDTSVPAALPVRRGRRKCHSVTSIQDTCSQLSRKNSVCKFPSLSFKMGLKDPSDQPKGTGTKKAAECADVELHLRESHRNKRTVSSAQHSDTPKRRLCSLRKKKTETFSDGASSGRRHSDRSEKPSFEVTERCKIPENQAATAISNEVIITEVSILGPPPDVDTPKVMEEEGTTFLSSPSVHLLLEQPCTPPCNQPPDILVADTPERDYGVKMTWRRRKGLMLLLKARGLLSESDVLIPS
ncbi:LOW QUALITY PROTEIN: RAD9, HUS1, RAD1-interacting nuclear orphan protein 1 [Pholidichthys leucotaenia]